MRVVNGRRIVTLSREDFLQKLAQYKKCVLDIGTGDGRFVYENALENSDTLFVGIDPAASQMKTFSAKANRKRLDNVFFVVGSVELLPDELWGVADEVFILLPWGSLLEHVVKPDAEFLKNRAGLLKPTASVASGISGAQVNISFGYSPELEPSETARLKLPELSEIYLAQELIPLYEKAGFKCVINTVLTLTGLTGKTVAGLADVSTSWLKAVSSSAGRQFYYLGFRAGK